MKGFSRSHPVADREIKPNVRREMLVRVELHLGKSEAQRVLLAQQMRMNEEYPPGRS
jgi:hypothetical protein